MFITSSLTVFVLSIAPLLVSTGEIPLISRFFKLLKCSYCKDEQCNSEGGCDECKPGFTSEGPDLCKDVDCSNCDGHQCSGPGNTCDVCRPGWWNNDSVIPKRCVMRDCRNCQGGQCYNDTCISCKKGHLRGDLGLCLVANCANCINETCADKRSGTCELCKEGWEVGVDRRCLERSNWSSRADPAIQPNASDAGSVTLAADWLGQQFLQLVMAFLSAMAFSLISIGFYGILTMHPRPDDSVDITPSDSQLSSSEEEAFEPVSAFFTALSSLMTRSEEGKPPDGGINTASPKQQSPATSTVAVAAEHPEITAVEASASCPVVAPPSLESVNLKPVADTNE